MKYINVKSNFIKEKIKKTKFKDRKYIDDLIFLEDHITGKIKNLGWAGSMKLHGLKNSYKKEYEAIYKELRPKEWKEIQKRDKEEREKDKKEEKEFIEEERKELEESKKCWIEAKGKV
tara:strand:+ start:316 stop:669 length:354 start_codon:yes stop_codon:yes gene_type:complete